MAAVKVDERTHQRLARLAEEERDTFGHLIDRALDAFEELRFWRQAEEAALALRANEGAWQEELAERRVLDGTLADGLEDERDSTDADSR